MDTSTATTATVDPTVRFAPALRSPALVGAKDRDGWVGLFDSDGFVHGEDFRGRITAESRTWLRDDLNLDVEFNAFTDRGFNGSTSSGRSRSGGTVSGRTLKRK